MESPALPFDDQSLRLERTAVAFAVIESAFVALRYVSLYLKRTRQGPDDILMPLGWLFNMALVSCALGTDFLYMCYSSFTPQVVTTNYVHAVMVKIGGAGKHLDWLNANEPKTVIAFSKLQIPFTITYALAVAFPKLTILGLYLRIFAQRCHRSACYVLIAIVSMVCCAVLLLACLQCVPLASVWNPGGHPNSHCIDISSFWRWGSFPNIITDILTMALPVPCIWKLQLSKRDKAGLFVTFATGSV